MYQIRQTPPQRQQNDLESGVQGPPPPPEIQILLFPDNQHLTWAILLPLRFYDVCKQFLLKLLIIKPFF